MIRYRNMGSGWLLAAAILMGSTGCATLKGEKSLTDSLPWIGDKNDEPKPYPNPVKMAVTWSPDVLFRPGSTPTRGFGGRVFFYDERSRPVPVEGELAVHGFEDVSSGQPPTIKRFAFTAEQFTSHFSQSDLGASYSIWIPWDAAGGVESRITLVPSFRTVEGKIVQGASAVIFLPGKSSRTAPEPGSPSDSTAWLDRPLPHSSGLTTTTIPAGDLAQRLARHAPPSQAAPQWSPPQPVMPAAHQGVAQAIAPQPGAAAQAPVVHARGTGEPTGGPVHANLPSRAEVLGTFQR